MNDTPPPRRPEQEAQAFVGFIELATTHPVVPEIGNITGIAGAKSQVTYRIR
jgi:hypothetical protein